MPIARVAELGQGHETCESCGGDSERPDLNTLRVQSQIFHIFSPRIRPSRFQDSKSNPCPFQAPEHSYTDIQARFGSINSTYDRVMAKTQTADSMWHFLNGCILRKLLTFECLKDSKGKRENKEHSPPFPSLLLLSRRFICCSRASDSCQSPVMEQALMAALKVTLFGSRQPGICLKGS